MRYANPSPPNAAIQFTYALASRAQSTAFALFESSKLATRIERGKNK